MARKILAAKFLNQSNVFSYRASFLPVRSCRFVAVSDATKEGGAQIRFYYKYLIGPLHVNCSGRYSHKILPISLLTGDSSIESDTYRTVVKNNNTDVTFNAVSCDGLV